MLEERDLIFLSLEVSTGAKSYKILNNQRHPTDIYGGNMLEINDKAKQTEGQ